MSTKKQREQTYLELDSLFETWKKKSNAELLASLRKQLQLHVLTQDSPGREDIIKLLVMEHCKKMI